MIRSRDRSSTLPPASGSVGTEADLGACTGAAVGAFTVVGAGAGAGNSVFAAPPPDWQAVKVRPTKPAQLKLARPWRAARRNEEAEARFDGALGRCCIAAEPIRLPAAPKRPSAGRRDRGRRL